MIMPSNPEPAAHIYNRVFEKFRIVDSNDAPLSEHFAAAAQWLDHPGCLFQRNNFLLASQVRTEGIIKAGLFITVVLKGSGQGGPRKSANRFRYADNTIVVMALREPTPCGGDAPRGAHMRAAGLAFPRASIEQLGLGDDFLDLFGSEGSPGAFLVSLKAPPRILAMAAEMLAPTVDGPAGQLLLSAHAMEILARTMSAVRQRSDIPLAGDRRLRRLQSLKDMIDADLSRAWSIAELARHAGISRRSLNIQFRQAFGVSTSDYLRTRRLETARDAIVQQGLSVNEAAYLVGYGNPANFATAFRRHFGHVPSRARF
jgi:AraC-like DNA-binding protein